MTTEDLGSRLDEVGTALKAVHDDMIKEGKKRDVRIRGNRILTTIAIIVGAIGISVGVGAVRALDNYKAQTKVLRIQACVQYNKQQDVLINAQIKDSHDLVMTLAAGSTAPDVAAQVAKYNAHHDALIRQSYAKRDCTPAGIAAYYKNA